MKRLAWYSLIAMKAQNFKRHAYGKAEVAEMKTMTTFKKTPIAIAEEPVELFVCGGWVISFQTLPSTSSL